MLNLTFKEFSKLSRTGNLIPLYAQLPADLDTPVSAFLKIRTGHHDFLLESVQGGEQWGRYSFLGTNPAVILRSRGLEVEIIRGKKIEKIMARQDPLTVTKKYLQQFKPVVMPELPRFFGGAIGYLGYDIVRYFEKIPDHSRDEPGLYESYFVISDTLVVFDALKQTILVIANIHLDGKKSPRAYYDEGQRKITKLIEKLRHPIPKQSKWPKSAIKLKPSHSELEFEKMVNRVKHYIREGDVFQTVISTRFEGRANIAPIELYRSIRRLNPSPYLYLMQFDDFAMVGSSPEVMVRLEDKQVCLRPIAGTRRRGRDEKDERKMEKELVSDPKELAEHVMLVDLGRNDLGRVCLTASIKVDEYAVVEKYSHVMHLVSHVSGKLKADKDMFDLIRATFPAGTLSGAPKVRAMEVIEELEGLRRGIYGGCVGYLGFDGNMDMAITIRTALLQKNRITIQAGAGVVYNSIPKLEYLECKNKAMALIKALDKME